MSFYLKETDSLVRLQSTVYNKSISESLSCNKAPPSRGTRSKPVGTLKIIDTKKANYKYIYLLYLVGLMKK